MRPVRPPGAPAMPVGLLRLPAGGRVGTAGDGNGGGMQRGAKLGRFVIQEDLGHGGMGGVFVGLDEETGASVAIKTLHPRFSQDAQMVPRFIREAEAYRRMSHPNIIRYVASGIQGGTYFIVVEHVRGRNLDAVLRKVAGPLGVRRSVLVMRDLLSAIAHAHSMNVIHRDIKPKNIMISSQGEVKLVDFGVAAADDALVETSVGAIIGSFRYAAPEQNQGQEVDERSDLYSLGLVFWEMLTGETALAGNSLIEVTTSQLIQGVDPPSAVNPEVPHALDVIAGRLLEKKREDRYETADEAFAAVDALAATLA